jgi:hypothetical protein
MDADKVVTAGFASASPPPPPPPPPPPATQSLTVAKAGTGAGNVVSSPAGIDCGSTCSANFTSGSQVVLTAVAGSGSSLTGWSGDCSGSIATCTLTMDAAKNVTATFDKNLPKLTVHVTGAGAGSVASTPAGIACPGTCSATFPSNTHVVLTATAAPKSFFNGWTSGACSGTGSCSVALAGEVDVTADFEPAPTIGDAGAPQLPAAYPPPVSDLSVNVSGDGSVTSEARTLAARTGAASSASINCGATSFLCYATVQPGSAVTLVARPGAGYTFQSWAGPCKVVGPATCVTNLAGSRTVTAHFAPKVKSSTFSAGLTKPRFKIKWRASIGTGTLRVEGTVGKPALARVQLRRPRGGPLLTENVTVAPGRFVLVPKLFPGLLAGGAHLFPGGFMVSLTGTSGKLKMPLQIQTVTLPAPPEGVVRKSYLSATQRSRPVKSVAADQHQAYANFVFQNQPVRGAKITVRWYWPNGKLLGTIKKSNRPTIFSFIREPPSDPLPKGNWVAELRAGSKIVQRLLIRVR